MTKNSFESRSLNCAVRSTHIDVVSVQLPDTPKQLEHDDHAHLDDPRQQPSSRSDFQREENQTRRDDQEEEEDDVDAAPELH